MENQWKGWTRKSTHASAWLSLKGCDEASPHTASSQPLGQTQAPRARVKGKNITSVPGMNQKMMNQKMMNQKMTNSLSTKVYSVRQQ